jgi:hypothetical protein
MKLQLSFASSLAALAALAPLVACVDPPPPPPVSPPSSVLTRTDPLAPGGACALGGTAIQVGIDLDGDGVLDDAEITQTTTVCREDAPATLTRIDVEPAGAHCPDGGRAVHIGPDRNHDGALGDDEIASTTYACDASAVFDGSFSAAMWSDPAAVAALSAATIVTGNLELDQDDVTSLPRLAIVGGTVRFRGAVDAAPGFDLPALAQIGGDLALDHRGLTGAISLPALKRIGGSLELDQPAVDRFSAPVLAEVGGAVSVVDTAIDRLELPALTRSYGPLTFTNNPALAAIRVPALVAMTGLFATHNPALTTIEAPAVTTTEDVRIAFSPVSTLSLTHLHAITGALVLRVTQLADLDGLPAVRTLGALVLDRNAPLASVAALGAVELIDGNLGVLGNPALHDLTGLEHVLVVNGDARIAGNDALATLDGLASLHAIHGELRLMHNPALASVAGLANLSRVDGDVTVSENPALPAADAAALIARLQH